MGNRLHKAFKMFHANVWDEDELIFHLQEMCFDSNDKFKATWRFIRNWVLKRYWHPNVGRNKNTRFNIFVFNHFIGIRGAMLGSSSLWHKFLLLNQRMRRKKDYVYLRCSRVSTCKGREVHVF